MDNIPTNEEPALANRKDLEAIQLQEKQVLLMFKLLKAATTHYFNHWRIYCIRFKNDYGAKCMNIGVAYPMI
jgi:hypothetical protein